MKVGDVVRLKSGGPAMTVLSFQDGHGEPSEEPTEYALCAWFAEAGKPESATFLAIVLDTAQPDPWLGFPHYKVQTR